MFFILSMLSHSALATQVTWEVVDCPFGEDSARVYQVVSTNTSGGYDSDTATHAYQGQFREYEISTCFENLFSLPGSDMKTPIDPSLIPQIELALNDEVSQIENRSEPEVWERYQIAARLYQTFGHSDLKIGELYLTASWTARDSVVGYHPGLNGPEVLAQLLDLGMAELDKPLTDEQRKSVLYSLARAAHRGGLHDSRERFLTAFSEVGVLEEWEQAEVARFRDIATRIEPRYQDMAIRSFEAALSSNSLADEDRARITYILADLHRRRGNIARAMPLFQSTAENDINPETIVSMSNFFIQEFGSSAP